ncbi:MAG TPA: hypothetical protein VL967_04310 [Terracidiphilus sp.]|nr:hypothetical protein [Terracidiphilus sp.]
MALLIGAVDPGQLPQSPGRPALPDANAQIQMHDKQAEEQNPDAQTAERKKQLSDESAQLLAMALKAEVDKTNKDMLSLNVIRKSDAIERLAHNVKEKMKLSAGRS